jgi:ElaB/YqjD/DUF883 family membrane-anchored ribosome-binding protein
MIIHDPKIEQALRLLQESSSEKRIELKQLLLHLYGAVKEAKHEALDSVKNAAIDLDKSAHQKPWHYMMGAALGGVLVGLFLRSKR